MLLLLDNTPVHTVQASAAEAANCNFELLPHPLNLPDFTPSDLFMFPKMKSYLPGRHFENDDDIICAVEEFLEDQDTIFFRDGISMFEYRWTNSVGVKENYTEK